MLSMLDQDLGYAGYARSGYAGYAGSESFRVCWVCLIGV